MENCIKGFGEIQSNDKYIGVVVGNLVVSIEVMQCSMEMMAAVDPDGWNAN